jgi:hypothetical protein
MYPLNPGQGIAVMNHQPSRTDKPRSKRPAEISDEEILEIRNSLRGLRYGSVQIVVQDGVVIQIDRTEKRRLRSGDATA